MQTWFTVFFFDIRHTCYDQLTSVKLRYPLTSITSPYHGLKFRTNRGHVFFGSLPLTKRCFSIESWARVRLTCWKQGWVVWKPVNDNPGLEVNRFHCFCFVLKLKTERQCTENLTTKLQNSNKNINSTLSWVSLIGLWATRSRSYPFRLT